METKFKKAQFIKQVYNVLVNEKLNADRMLKYKNAK